MLVSPAPFLLVVGSFVAFVASADVYGKLGDEVMLKPLGVNLTGISSILWKVGTDLLVDWDEDGTTFYPQYKGRSHLNNQTGDLTITGLLKSDSNTFTPEINQKQGTPIRLRVISPVPVPTIDSNCSPDTSTCTLTCVGVTPEPELLKYSWRADDVEDKQHGNEYILKTDSPVPAKISCELKNPVSQESSKPFNNPHVPEKSLNINTGITVFVILLTALLLLVIFHRIKAGTCFYNKNSMPWQADFWRKAERQQSPRDAEANPQRKGQLEEEVALREG